MFMFFFILWSQVYFIGVPLYTYEMIKGKEPSLITSISLILGGIGCVGSFIIIL